MPGERASDVEDTMLEHKLLEATLQITDTLYAGPYASHLSNRERIILLRIIFNELYSMNNTQIQHS